MKQKIYLLGIIVSVVVFTGAIFKINHYPGAGVLLTLGISALAFVFIPLALRDNYYSAGSGKSPLLYVVTFITCLVIFTAMLFKLMHWPYAGLLLTIALPFPYLVFLPVFIAVTSRDRNFNIYNTVFVLLLLVTNSVFSGLLALNVTSETVNASYLLSGNYINQERGMVAFQGKDSRSPVDAKIDSVLNSIDEGRSLVLGLEDLTPEQWKNNPGHLYRPDIRGSAANGLGEEGHRIAHKLYNDLDGMVKLMSATAGYESFARNASSILVFNSDLAPDDWYDQVLNDFPAWVLIYFDALDANLSLIKGSNQ